MNLDEYRHWSEEAFFQNGFFLQWNEFFDFVAWGNSQWSKKPLSHKISCYIPDFYMKDDKPWCVFEHGGLFSKKYSWEKNSRENSPQGRQRRRLWKDPPLEEFASTFHRIKENIHRGDITKAVPIVFAESKGEISEAEKRVVLAKSQKSFSLSPGLKFSPWPKFYGWWNDRGEGLLGCTPELLFEYKSHGKVVKTMALAGTKKLGEDSLLDDPKECLEHEIVVDAIYDRLQSFGFVDKGPAYEWNYGQIQHLRTDIVLRRNHGSPGSHGSDGSHDSKGHRRSHGSHDSHESHGEKNCFHFQIFHDLCERLHPTPALGLASNKLHWQQLKEMDPPVLRKRFGAPFGVLFPEGVAKVCVAIRNIQWFGGNSYLGSGCGIVEPSQLQREWEELSLKRQSVIQILAH